MLSSFKQRSPYSSSHSIPNGGLGGFVSMVQESTRSDLRYPSDLELTKSRKRPTPIQVHGLSASPGPHTCPINRSGPTLPVIPRAPTTPPSTIHEYVSPVSAASDGVNRVLSPYHLWDKCKDNPWFATTSRKDSPFAVSIEMEKKFPVELPGSILLPNRSPVKRNSSCESDQQNQPKRWGSPSTSDISPPPSLIHSCKSTPEPRTELQPAFNSPPQKNFPELSLRETESSKLSRSRSLSLMSVEQLLKLLPEIGIQEATGIWMSAMEKEFAKLRGYVFSFEVQNNFYQAGLHLFCEEIHDLMEAAKVSCKSQDVEFKNARELSDCNQESDLSKIMHVHDKLCDAVPSLTQCGPQKDLFCAAFNNIRAILLDCLQALSSFVRKQITFRIRCLSGGLSDGLAKAVESFDRGSITSQRNALLEIVTELDSRPKKSMSSSQYDLRATSTQPVKTTPTNSAPFFGRARVVQVNPKKVEIPLAYVKPTYIEQQNSEESQIIDSYLETQSDLSHDRLVDQDSSRGLGTHTNELDKPARAIHQHPELQSHHQPPTAFCQDPSPSRPVLPRGTPLSITPASSSTPSNLSTTSTPPPIRSDSANIPPPPTQPRSQSSSPIRFLDTSRTADDYRYTVSPDTNIDTDHSLHTSPSHITPTPEVTDIHLKLDKLEAQNNLLRTTVELLTRQFQRVEAGIVSPVVSTAGSGEAMKSPRSGPQRPTRYAATAAAGAHVAITPPGGIGGNSASVSVAVPRTFSGSDGHAARQRGGGVWM